MGSVESATEQAVIQTKQIGGQLNLQHPSIMPFDLEVPDQWNQINTEQLRGTVIVIGSPDSGKSTLVRWLCVRLCQTHQRIGWLDGDPGQTTLGVPATINLALLDRTKDCWPYLLATIFIGSTSPQGHIITLLDGLRRLQKLNLATNATALIVDTTGMVDAFSGGDVLKKNKIESLQPSTIIALQRDRELEHILAPIKADRRFTIYDFSPCEAAVRRSPERRSRRRQTQFLRYFQSANQHCIQHDMIPVYGQIQPAKTSLMAFVDKMGFALALGVVLSISSESMEIATPLADLSNVAGLRFGTLQLDPLTGKEI